MASDYEIRELFKKAGVSLAKEDVWAVQGTPVVKHKALERLAAGMSIAFDAPQILRAERDEAVILVTAHIGDKTEWSIGEALVNANYRVTGKMAPYVYAMAEKRAKDRVILKLAGLHGVYSEDEADEFKQPQRSDQDAKIEAYIADQRSAMLDFSSTDALKHYWSAEASRRTALGIVKGSDAFATLFDSFVQVGESLKKKEAA